MNIIELFNFVKSINQQGLNTDTLNNINLLINSFTTNSYYTNKYIEYMLIYDILYKNIYDIPLVPPPVLPPLGMIGGHKLKKYSYKFKNNKLNTKYNLKYNYYLNLYKNNQIGGYNSRDLLNNIDTINASDEVITKDLNLVCDSMNNTDDDDDDSIFYNDTAICIKKQHPINNENKYNINYQNYLLRRLFRGISTDEFMKELYEDKQLYKTLFNYIFCELNLHISYFIHIYNRDNGHDLNNDHIKFLYKGGNTIRLLLDFNASNIYIRETQTIIKESINKIKVGDWDFNLIIEYQKLKDELGFSEEKCTNLKNKLVKVIALALHNIQNNIIKILINFNFDNFIINCTREANTEESKNIISTITREINNFTIDSNDKIILFDFKNYYINNDNTNSLIINNSNDMKYTIVNKFNNLLDRTNINQTKQSYIVYIDNINGITLKGNVDFTLFRFKLDNNILYNNITLKDRIKNKQMKAGIELIDVSIVNMKDKKYTIFKSLFEFIYPQGIKYTIINFKILDNYGIDISIPSSEYMIIDILSMLYTEKLFPWFDLKYNKRINRIILLYSSIHEPIYTNFINTNSSILKKIIDIKNKDKTVNFFIESYKTFLYNSIKKSIFEYIYLILIFLFSFDLSQQIFKINIRGHHSELSNYKLFEEFHDKISYDYLFKIYNIFKEFLIIKDINNIHFIYFNNELFTINETLGNNLFNFIITNIFEIIIFLIFVKDRSKLEHTHLMYSDNIYQIYINCDNHNMCDGISGNIYKMSQIIDNCEMYLDDFDNYIKNLINIFIINSYTNSGLKRDKSNYETDMLC